MFNELTFIGQIQKGSADKAKVKLIQEWLGLNGYSVNIDGIFGSATEQAIKNFQRDRNQVPSGIVDDATFKMLTAPMAKAILPITPVKGATLSDMMTVYAKQHLSVHPREIGGQNRGPWVRLYMDGNEGDQWPWCAGFVSFILKQACQSLNISIPFNTSPSCALMAESAKSKGFYKTGPEIANIKGNALNGAIFFVRKPNQWVHTGIVIQSLIDSFATIEGNTNDDGSPEGYEVCQRTRGYDSKDFIVLGGKA